MHKLYRTVQEQPEPLEAKIQGEIPKWICGSLYRNGPGVYEFGEDKYNHLFDPMAILQQFKVKNGKVLYSSRYLQSDMYKKNSKFNRIVCRGIGTEPTIPDPCKNIFQRFLSYFQFGEDDNSLVTFYPFQDDLYVASETNIIHKIDPESLDTVEKVNISNFVDVRSATAHPHWEKDGTLHNIGRSYTGGPKTCFVQFPGGASKDSKVGGPLPQGKIVAAVPCPYRMSLNYIHSFAMTENYYVYIDQPLIINIFKVLTQKIRGVTAQSAIEWYPDISVTFHIIDRTTGDIVNKDMCYEAKPFLMFHHVNAYEENGHIVLDVCAFASNEPMEIIYMKDLTSPGLIEKWRRTEFPSFRRFILPLNVAKESCVGENLVLLKGETATAERISENTIMCTHERMGSIGTIRRLLRNGFEFPQINYQKYNTRKYRYCYCVGWHKTGDSFHTLNKLDVKTRTYLEWAERDSYPSEPVFVPNPDGNDEDDGVLLSAVNHSEQEDSDTDGSYLLVLDAKTMKELARATFDLKRLPRDFHGLFRQTQNS